MNKPSILIGVIIAIGVAFLTVSCGESKEDKKSREEISSLIRQLNVFASEFPLRLESTPLFTEAAIVSYFGKLNPPLKERRIKLATVKLSQKFAIVRTMIDKVIVSWLEIHESRKYMRERILELYNEDGSFRKRPYPFSYDSTWYEDKLKLYTGQLQWLHIGADSLNKMLSDLSITDTLALTFTDSSEWRKRGGLEDGEFSLFKRERLLWGQ